MKNFLVPLLLQFTCLPFLAAQTYEPQATTVKKDSCNVVITIQVGVETDSLSDIARIQAAANECFAVTCDLPCENGEIGKCKVISKVVVVDWKKLSVQDRDKFHHVKMVPGTAISYVDRVGIPNHRKASGGTWGRPEYDPKVYCHEIWHLAGLPDRYRDCRRDRVALGVDNCKDGKTCTPEQIEKGECPSCDGHEHDCMGSDVKKSADCNINMMEVIRLANDITLVCSEECCKTRTRLPPEEDSNYSGPHIGVLLDAGVGLYNQRHKEFKDDKLNMIGGAFSIGGYGLIALMTHIELMSYLKLNYAAVSKKIVENEHNGIYPATIEEYYRHRFADLSLGANLIYRLQLLSLYAGPEVAFILMAKSKYYGTYTYNNMTSPLGQDEWRNITEKKNIQLGINIGAMYQVMLLRNAMMLSLNIYYPFTNYIAYEYYRNRLYNFNLGLMLPLMYTNR